MNTFFTFSAQRLAQPLVIVAIAAFSILAALGVRRPHFARIGLRNISRRRLRTALIVFGLMLSTSFVAMSLAVDDTITQAVKTVAVFNLGRVDEDVVAHSWAPKYYNQRYGSAVARTVAGDPRVAGVAPALVIPNMLVADETQRQVHGGVIAIGFNPASAGPLGDLRTTANANVSTPLTALDSNEVYLNRTAGQALFAQQGDTIYLYSDLWPAQRYGFRVRNVVSGGLSGETPMVLLPLPVLQQLTHYPNLINHVYVANTGNGLTGVGYSNAIQDRIEDRLPPALRVDTVKLDGVNLATQAEDIFGRILTLFTLFALFIGLLLIFLIFVLLAAERRTELGVVRAMGMRRAHVVRLLLFEGAGYDMVAAAAGVLAGLGLGALIVVLVSPAIARIGFPLQTTVEPHSLIVAFCLGLLFTLATIWLAAWSVSRMTIAAAMRDLPEPPPPQASLFALVWRALIASRKLLRAPVPAVAAWTNVASALVSRGFVPAAVGWQLLKQSSETSDLLSFSLGLSALAVGVVLILRSLALATASRLLRRHPTGGSVSAVARASSVADRLSAVLIGAALALYWSLPFDALSGLGISRFSGGIEVFFVAGVMMVFGAVWTIAPNLDLVLRPLRWLLDGLGYLRHVSRIALVYPAHQRFRTGISLSLFSLVCFTAVVMACIASSATQSFDTLPEQAAGYDIAGQSLFSPVGGVASVQHAIHTTPFGGLQDVQAVSSASSLPLGILPLDAHQARWRLYPASQVQGAFLDGVGLPLVARASGFSSDAAVWDAVRTQPGNVVIDAAALTPADAALLGLKQPAAVSAAQFLAPPIAANLPRLANLQMASEGIRASSAQNALLAQIGVAIEDPDNLSANMLRLDHIARPDHTIAPTPLWAMDLRGGHAVKLTVIGIVNNDRGQRYGLLGSPQTFAPTEVGFAPFSNEYYYFKLKPGVNPQTEARGIGSVLLDHGFETTIIQDALLTTNGANVFISRIIVGLAILTLLVGMAALAVTGSRAVVERRQQIGMLRALGFRRLHVQLIFLMESLLIGIAGTGIGLLLGLVLCRNLFAVDFFERVHSGITLVIPWAELAAICAAAIAASLIAAVLPAWQAGHVAPADAIRYE